MHSTIFFPLHPTFLVVALTNGVSLTGAKSGEGEEEDEDDNDFCKEEEEEEEGEYEEEEDGADNDFCKEEEEEEDGVRLTGAKRGDLEKEDEEEDEEEDGEEDGEEKEEDLGFTEEPDSEGIDLLGVESYEEETRGDLGGYW